MEFTEAIFGPAAAPMPDELRSYGRALVGSLPLGVQRRVAFAQALSHQPDLLMLDEPTSGVDPLGRARLWETIVGAAEGGAGVLVTTHCMEEAHECGRLVVMADGRVVAEGTASEIIGGRRVVAVEAETWSAAFGALESAGLQVALAGRGLRVPGAGLADVRRALGGSSRDRGRGARHARGALLRAHAAGSRCGGRMSSGAKASRAASGERASGRRARGRRAPGRRPGESGTRAAIGEAAREALFADAMRLPVVPSEMLTAALASRPQDSGLGAHLVRTALTLWESAGVKDTFLGLLRSAVTSEQASVMLREFIADTILATVAKATGLDKQCGPGEAEFRASLVATQMLGLALTRLVLGLPASRTSAWAS